MEISSDMIKDLREKTGISVMQCKKALEEAGGDMEKAIIILKKKSSAIAEKKADRELAAGSVAAYIHGNGMIGAMVELMSETDFVSKNEEFKILAREIAMQISATNPKFTKRSDVSSEEIAKASEVFAADVAGKPEELKAKILEGKLNAYFKDQVLLEQDYIKNPEKTIGNLIEEATQKFGEKIEIGKIARFSPLEK